MRQCIPVNTVDDEQGGPEAAERARQAQAAIEARKAHGLTATKDSDGNVVITLDDGTVATIPIKLDRTPMEGRADTAVASM